nr:immunoglobulin light chain junction region [Macaca mulatta]
YQRYISAPFTF